MSFVAVLFAGLMFTSCEKKSEAELLLGKWSMVSFTMTEKGTSADVKIESNEYFYFTFASDGKYVQDVNAQGEKWTHNGNYELNGKTLVLEKGTLDEEVYNITELTASKLTMETKAGTTSTIMYLNKVK